MKYTSRIRSIYLVLITHMIYITYYYIRDGYVGTIELIGLPVVLIIAWYCGRQFDKVRFLSQKDYLTQVFNRRFVCETFSKVAAKADAGQKPLVVFAIDVNKFKLINDTYGHKKGDEMLIQVSRILVNNSRKTDIVARWGGDEFIIIAPNTDQEEAVVITMRIEDELKEFSQAGIDVSVSVGTATYPKDAATLDDLIKIADDNMYQVKSTMHQSQHSRR
ncbi:GGDEF domain-containing protein [Paenibacillus silvisoli]|uniref:GGDEF domain-containing protein n=1 Tax=Paenibacillus silvisoli TaxID=3110539 RepID=UPI002804C52A|nr:GGDEF domain-containing protein [Paenibacillus silvisoli]